MKISRRTFAAFGIALMSATALPGMADAKSLKIGLAAAVTSLDPHYYNATPNHTVAMHVFDTLTMRDPAGRVEPWLATSWEVKGDNEWEFKLRDDVRWHDGEPFTAADVAFTLERVKDVPGSIGGFSGLINTIASTEAVDAHTLRITTSTPTPNMPVFLSQIEIVSRHVGKGASTEDYNAGRVMVGTGPYKFARYLPGERVELARNDDWWGERQEWDNLSLVIVTNVATRMAALMSGDLDIVEVPNAPDIERLRQNSAFSIHSAPSLRVSYVLPFFQAGEGADPVRRKDGTAFEQSPLLNRDVRRALSMAINRQGIAERVMLGTGIPTGQFMPEGAYSYDPSILVPTADPEGAKKLLAEAGFADGFALNMVVANDRVPYNVEVAQALAQMWARIGIDMTVDSVPTSVAIPRATAQRIPIYIDNFGNSTAEVGRLLTAMLQTVDPERSRGEYNWIRYSSPDYDAAVDAAVVDLDPETREAKLQAAARMALEDYAMIPMYHFVNAWAAKADISYEARGDAMTLATFIRSAPQ